MSWDNVINRGSGQCEFRLAFEGLPYEAVTSPLLERRLPQVRGESGWSTTDYYIHADGVLEGSGTMVRAALIRLDATPSADEFVFSNWPTLSTGWGLYVDTSRQVNWRIEGTTVTSAALDVGKTYLVVGTYDGSTQKLYVDTTLSSTSVSHGSIGTGSFKLAIGVRGDNSGTIEGPATNCTILACAASDSVSTVGEIDDYWREVKQAGDLVSFTGVESLWSCARSSSLAFDHVGSVNFTKNGTPTLTSRFKPVYDDWDGRERIAGLQREGLMLEEQGILKTADMEAGGFTATIVDDQGHERWTELFSKTPSVRTYLTADAGVAATSFTVESTSGISAGDHLFVGTETIQVGTSSGTTLSDCSRARWDSIAQKHHTESGDRLAQPEVTDWPTGLVRRRAWLYAYGQGDNHNTNGTLLWRGVCLTDAKLNGDGSSWSITVDPIKTLFDQDLGTDLDEPTGPRGIYYPGEAPFRLVLNQHAGSDASGAVEEIANIYLVGHYETQRDFCDALNTKIDAATSAFTVAEIRAVPEGNDGWHLEYTTDSASAKFISAIVSSLVDGKLLRKSGQLYDKNTGDNAAGGTSTNTTYAYRWQPADVPGERTVPRGVYAKTAGVAGVGAIGDERVSDTDLASAPQTRMYLGGRFSVSSSIDAATVETSDGSGNRALEVDTVSASDRYIDFRKERIVGEDGASDFGFIYTRSLPATFTFTRRYADGTLSDLRTAITDLAQTDGNKGTVPFVVTSDWASPATVVDESREGRWLPYRKYTATQSINLWDYIREEAKILGCYWRLNSTGALELAKLRQPVATSATASAITEDEVLIDNGYPGWEKNAEGTVNVFDLKTGYDVVEDEHKGTRFVVRDVQSISRRKRSFKIEAAPKSEPGGASAGLVNYEEVVDLTMPLFGLFGGDYAVVTVEVPFKLFSVLVGDFVTITHKNLPDPDTGKRGLSQRPALVLSRRWDLDQGRGTFRLLVPFDRIVGYAPSVRVTGASGSGTAWTLTVATTDTAGNSLFQSGQVLSDHFDDSYEIRLLQWNTASPTVRTGSIDASGVDDGASTIDVTLDSSWAGLGGNTYYLGYADAASVIAAQQIYAFLADTSARIGFSTSAPAHQYAA